MNRQWNVVECPECGGSGKVTREAEATRTADRYDWWSRPENDRRKKNDPLIPQWEERRGRRPATPDNAGRSSIRRQDIEWLVDDSIRAGRISVSRGAEILGIGIREMRAIGTRFSESTGSEGGAS